MSKIADDFPYWTWYTVIIENCIKTAGLRGNSPAGAFFMPEGGEADAKETEEAVFLPRMPKADGREVL